MIRCASCDEFISVLDCYCWNCGEKNTRYGEGKNNKGGMICKSCRNVILKKTDKYCRDCGTDLRLENTQLLRAKAHKVISYPVPKQKMTIKSCSRCRKEYDKRDKFCENCGEKL
ncbi:zinc-ribbon domain-containing protein [Candidatus Woesearchaeota archaeon]|nr:zinc-ribbon domain-containing protein [Candidatus Woesearchaeota archaeon]